MKNIILAFLLAGPASAQIVRQNGGGSVNGTAITPTTVAASTITVTGAIGISTTAPQWPLTVVNANPRGYDNSGASGVTINNAMFWDQSGRVASFTIRTSTEYSGINNSSNQSFILEANGNATGGTNIFFQKSSGTWSSRTQAQAANAMAGQFAWGMWTGSAYSTVGRLYLKNEGVPGSSSNNPTYMGFDTASTGTVSGSEKVRIEANGGLRMFVMTKANIDAAIPNQIGSAVLCSDCTVPYDVCVATAASLSAYRATIFSAISTAVPGTLVPKGCGTGQ